MNSVTKQEPRTLLLSAVDFTMGPSPHDARPCRIVVLAANHARVSKILSLLNEMEQTDLYRDIHIEYLACVPIFDSYQDEAGKQIRYLMRVDYYENVDIPGKPGSLLEFFDEYTQKVITECPESSASSKPSFQGITGVAVGNGIDDEEDIARISRFIETMTRRQIPLESMRPNKEFQTMQEELAAFRALSEDEKAKVTQSGTMGPAKMAKLCRDLACRLIDDAFHELEAAKCSSNNAIATEESPEEELRADEPSPPHFIDPDKDRYACRKCRFILLGANDLQDPPHVPSKHKFSQRKHDVSSNACQSLFLHSGIDWMGNMSEVDGKLTCPNCETKVGIWNWSGAQCSCGSWIVPAIQIPISRVDLVPAQRPGHLPAGTVISPTIQKRFGGMEISDVPVAIKETVDSSSS